MRSLVYFLDCKELLVSIDLLFFHGHLVLSQVQSGQISEPFFFFNLDICSDESLAHKSILF